MNRGIFEAAGALNGDPKRQAGASIRGFEYQFLRTVESWLQLHKGQKLYVECAEDFDVVSADGFAEAHQVKSAAGTITLNSASVRTAIADYWQLRARNRGRDIRVRYVTRQGIGLESTVGLKGRPGLKLWAQAARGNVAAARLVAGHLLKSRVGDDELQVLLGGGPETLIAELFSKIEWECNQPSAEATRMNVERLAIQLGGELKLGPMEAVGTVPALLERCRNAAMEREIERRSLTREDALLCMEQGTTLAFVNQVNFRERVEGRDYLRAFLAKNLGLLERVAAAGGQLAVEIEAGVYEALGDYVGSMRLAESLCFDEEIAAELRRLNDAIAAVWTCISDDNYIPSGWRWKFDNMRREDRDVQAELARKKLEIADSLAELAKQLESVDNLARRSAGDLLTARAVTEQPEAG